ncbi:MAG: tetratricopeptide repeat protein, partial [Actinomycetales bacterium]|nr:tetratricopeptide repeat protein [Actinomycetales bacterium]
TPAGGLSDAVAEARPALQVHLLPAMRAKATQLGVGGRVLGQIDTVIVRSREAALEGAVEGVNRAIAALGGAAVPRLGLVLDWTARGFRAVRQGRQERGLEQAEISFGGLAEQSRRSLAEEFADLVLATVHPQVPAVVVVEDAHLIDASVREFLEQVSARVADRPVLVLAAAWPGGQRSNPAYRDWRAWASQHGNLEVWQVPDLTPDSLTVLLRRAAPATTEPDANTIVSRYPNPLTLKLFLGLKPVRRVIDRNDGALSVADLDLSVLPVTIKGLYAQRIAELPPHVRDAVTAAEGTLPAGSPTGPYTPEVVGAAAEQALDVAEEETVTGLGHAVEDGLVTTSGMWHSFRETLLAEVLAEHLDPLDRAELQEATLNVLREHIAAARADSYSLDLMSTRDVQVAWWLTQLLDRNPQTINDAVAAATTARTLLDTHQFALAAALYEHALPHLPPDHPDTLASRNNLAGAYASAGDLARAVRLYEQTLADLTRVLGPDHPSTLTSRNNLAYAYASAGDLGRAVPLYEQTLADLTRVLGPDHPDTLTSRNNLAYAYASAG